MCYSFVLRHSFKVPVSSLSSSLPGEKMVNMISGSVESSPTATGIPPTRSIFTKVLFNVSEDAAAGAFAGLVARTLTAPFDVIKIRYQLLCRRVAHTPSMFHAFKNIVAEEGFRALWKGNLAATYLWISYAVVQFGVYGMMKDWIDHGRQANSLNNLPKISLTNQALLMFVAGSLAGTTATIATYPFDIMRTQFAVQGKTKAFHSMTAYIGHTYKAYGIRGFYSGLGPAIIGVTPYIGLNFAFYETLKSTTKKFHDTDNKVSAVIAKGVLGGIAGGSAKFLMYPLDTVKKRLQAQTLQSSISELFQGPRYKGMQDCFVMIWKNEGLRGFYRGIIPTMAKAVSASAITFMAYEGAKEMIKIQKALILDHEKQYAIQSP